MADELSHQEVTELLEVIQRIDCAELSLDYAGFSIRVVRGPAESLESARDVGSRRKSVPGPVGAGEVGGQHVAELGTEPEPIVAATDDAVSAGEQGELAPHWIAVKSPMVGTFYGAPSPTEPPFVVVGDKVAADSTVCMLEVMKLYTEIKADCAGTVARVEATDGQLVEHGQALLWIEPL